MSDVEEEFVRAVQGKLGFLVEDHGFKIVRESRNVVRMESDAVALEAWLDSRGELEVRVFRLDAESAFGRWSYVGLVGRASVTRLVEIAADQLRENEGVIRGDSAVFEQLADEQRREAHELTARVSDPHPDRPSPSRGQLP